MSICGVSSWRASMAGPLQRSVKSRRVQRSFKSRQPIMSGGETHTIMNQLKSIPVPMVEGWPMLFSHGHLVAGTKGSNGQPSSRMRFILPGSSFWGVRTENRLPHLMAGLQAQHGCPIQLLAVSGGTASRGTLLQGLPVRHKVAHANICKAYGSICKF